jgi:hypothetical protein
MQPIDEQQIRAALEPFARLELLHIATAWLLRWPEIKASLELASVDVTAVDAALLELVERLTATFNTYSQLLRGPSEPPAA